MYQSIFGSLDVSKTVLITEDYHCTLNNKRKGKKKMNEASPDCISQQVLFFFLPPSHWRHSKSPLFLYWNCLKQWWKTIARFSQEQQPQLQGRRTKLFSHGFYPIPSFIWGKKKGDTLFSLRFLNWFGNHEIAMWYQSQNKTGCFTFSLYNSWVWGQ